MKFESIPGKSGKKMNMKQLFGIFKSILNKIILAKKPAVRLIVLSFSI